MERKEIFKILSFDSILYSQLIGRDYWKLVGSLAYINGAQGVQDFSLTKNPPSNKLSLITGDLITIDNIVTFTAKGSFKILYCEDILFNESLITFEGAQIIFLPHFTKLYHKITWFIENLNTGFIENPSNTDIEKLISVRDHLCYERMVSDIYERPIKLSSTILNTLNEITKKNEIFDIPNF